MKLKNLNEAFDKKYSIVEDIDEEIDGWGSEVEQETADVLADIYDLQYEINSCVRGSLTGCTTIGELSEYIHDLAARLDEVSNNILSCDLVESLKEDKTSAEDAQPMRYEEAKEYFKSKGFNLDRKTYNMILRIAGKKEPKDESLKESKKLTEKNWVATISAGSDLRKAIEAKDYQGVLDGIEACYKEMLDKGIIDEDDFNAWIEDFHYIEVDDEDVEDEIDYALDDLYDACDNLNCWLALNESFKKPIRKRK